MTQQQLNDLISRMTLREKAAICSGRDFWTTKPFPKLGIGSFVMSDGPHGLRKENEDDDNLGMKMSFPATAFPPAVNMASSWDPDLIREIGVALGEQCLDQQVDILLGPGVNIKRSPLCGRNFEYFSEDPYLAGKMGAAYIKGVESTGVGTSLKHFAVNNNEYLRMTINSVVDERALREIYLSAFEECVKQGKPRTVMASYNRINGVYATDNPWLLDTLLRKQWGYEGMVVSDWNAANDRVAGVKAGMDLEMPTSGNKNDRRILAAIKSGALTEEELDSVVARVLRTLEVCENNRRPFKADYDKAHELARRAADESIILLKNDAGRLPLSKDEKLLVVGKLAEHSRYQGAGSSRINPYKLVSVREALDEAGVGYEYAEGYSLDGDGKDAALERKALELAKGFDGTIVCCIGLTDTYESEGYDRTHMTLPPSHDDLVTKLAGLGKPLVVVLFGGSPVEMPWLDKVDTLVNAYLPGEACGEAVLDILTGAVNPSGKLAETYPFKLEDNINAAYFPMGPKNVEYRESIYVGYRYYDSAKKQVAFPFGHGLSYTTFAYSDLNVDDHGATFTVTNTGKVAGAEVAQMYVRDLDPVVFKADKELKGFAKVFLAPGESKTVTLPFDERTFAFFNTAEADWHRSDGEYEILIGASSRDIRLSAKRKFAFGESSPVNARRAECPVYYDIAGATEIPADQFRALYDKPIPPNVPSKRGEFDDNTTLGEFGCCLLGKLILKAAPALIKSQVPNADMTTMLILTQGMQGMPLRALVGISSGIIDSRLVDGLLLWGNKHRLRGFFKMIAGLFGSLSNIEKKNRANMQRKLQKRAEQKAKAKEQND